MSTPENPLAKYSSHNAVHILIMASDGATANTIESSAGLGMYERPSQDIDQRYAIQTIPNQNDQRYVILYDGRRDANFYIDKASWETTLVPKNAKTGTGTKGAKGLRYADTIETQGEITIIEPLGIDFLKILVNSVAGLLVDPTSIVFMLKTIFIGYNADGTSETLSYINPFSFTVVDLKSKIDAGGSEHTLSVVGRSNGVTKLPHFSNLGNGLAMTYGNTTTLAQAMQQLETAINEKYDFFYNGLIESFGTALTALEVSQTFAKVKYKIVLDSIYRGGNYVMAGDVPDEQKVNTNTYSLKFSDNESLESCIRKVLSACPALVAESSSENETRYMHKINSTFGVNNTDDPNIEPDAYEVTYNLNRQQIVSEKPTTPLQPRPGEFITFDYIYTGKNVDIIDFDISMDMGLAFFQTSRTIKHSGSTQAELNTANRGASNGAYMSSDPASSADVTAGSPDVPVNRRTPLFLGMKETNPSISHRLDPVKTATFDDLIERQARLESVAANVKIIGNPTILNDVNAPYIEQLRQSQRTEAERAQDAEDGTTSFASNFLFGSPMFVKINIKYPTSAELTEVTDFWYRGFYRILTIQNNFDGGKFTQDLEMFSVSQTNDAEDALTSSTRHRESIETQPPVPADVLREGAGGKVNTGEEIIPTTSANSNPRLKSTRVKIGNLSENMTSIFDDIVCAWAIHAPGVVPVITSGNDSRHKVGSLHFSNEAIDVRGNNISRDVAFRIRNELIVMLGRDYDVIYEVFPNFPANNHFHIEYDPKPKGSVRAEAEADNDEDLSGVFTLPTGVVLELSVDALIIKIDGEEVDPVPVTESIAFSEFFDAEGRFIGDGT